MADLVLPICHFDISHTFHTFIPLVHDPLRLTVALGLRPLSRRHRGRCWPLRFVLREHGAV